jgi:hypothetical protein
MHTRTITTLVVLTAALVSVEARDKRAHFDSTRLTTPITVDGSATDWAGPLAPFNDQPLSMAAGNDGESLYLVLTASDPAVRRQILRQGLIVWFDGGGKDRKKFGVKFPIGVGFSEEDFGRRRRAGGGSGSPIQDSEPREGGQTLLEPPNRLEVLGASKDDARSYTADQAPGIAVKVGQAEGLLAYELKVPLAPSDAHPYGVSAQAGQTISVGLEMPKLEVPEGRGREGGLGGGTGGGGGRIGGFGGGGMGHRGGGGGGGGGMERPEQAKPLSGWVEVQLAAK